MQLLLANEVCFKTAWTSIYELALTLLGEFRTYVPLLNFSNCFPHSIPVDANLLATIVRIPSSTLSACIYWNLAGLLLPTVVSNVACNIQIS